MYCGPPAVASGSITIESPDYPTTARVHGGCRLEADFYNAFTSDGRITLVLDENHAGFHAAQEVADLVNNQLSFQATGELLAKALDRKADNRHSDYYTWANSASNKAAAQRILKGWATILLEALNEARQ